MQAQLPRRSEGNTPRTEPIFLYPFDLPRKSRD
jgi:hypothetical protein